MNKHYFFGLICLLVSACAGDVKTKRISLDILDEGKRGDIAYYQDKPFTGVGYSFFENGNLEFEMEYKDGVTDGVSKMFWENGNLKLETESVDGVINGLFRTFYENGKLMTQEYHVNGVAHGESKNWDEHGNLFIKFNYKNGKKNYPKGLLLSVKSMAVTYN